MLKSQIINIVRDLTVSRNRPMGFGITLPNKHRQFENAPGINHVNHAVH